MWIPLILSIMAAPPAFGVRLSSPTNRSLAQSPETMTFRSVYFPLTVYWFAMSVAHLRMAAFPDSMGPLGGSITASSVSKAMLASTVPAEKDAISRSLSAAIAASSAALFTAGFCAAYPAAAPMKSTAAARMERTVMGTSGIVQVDRFWKRGMELRAPIARS